MGRSGDSAGGQLQKTHRWGMGRAEVAKSCFAAQVYSIICYTSQGVVWFQSADPRPDPGFTSLAPQENHKINKSPQLPGPLTLLLGGWPLWKHTTDLLWPYYRASSKPRVGGEELAEGSGRHWHSELVFIAKFRRAEFWTQVQQGFKCLASPQLASPREKAAD